MVTDGVYRRAHIVKMPTLFKAIYGFNAIPVIIPMTFCTKIVKTILQFVWNHRRP